MFGNVNHRQKQDEQPTDENVREENSLGPQIQPMGNEGAIADPLGQMINGANAGAGNEFLAGLGNEAGDAPGKVIEKIMLPRRKTAKGTRDQRTPPKTKNRRRTARMPFRISSRI